MKTLIQSGKLRFRKLSLALIAVLLVASSCNKNDDDMVLEGEAEIMIVNAASGSAEQDFYLDDTKINAEALAYNESTAYISTPAGYGRKAEFRDNGSATANFTGYLDMLPDRKYTVFFATKADGSGSSSAAFTDDASSSSSKAKVRFVNLASGFNAANLVIAGGSAIASNIAYGTGSGFLELNPGSIALQTVLVTGGTSSFDLGTFDLQAGKIYTIYTSGSLTGTVAAHLISHN